MVLLGLDLRMIKNKHMIKNKVRKIIVTVVIVAAGFGGGVVINRAIQDKPVDVIEVPDGPVDTLKVGQMSYEEYMQFIDDINYEIQAAGGSIVFKNINADNTIIDELARAVK